MNKPNYNFYNEYCESANNKDENDRRALLMWHLIQRAIGKKEHELSKKAPPYTIKNGQINVAYTHYL